MRTLFYLGHPAHYHLFRHTIEELVRSGHEVLVLIKSKDVLETLVRGAGWDYLNTQPRGRRSGGFDLAAGLVQRTVATVRAVRRFRPRLMLGTSAEIGLAGRLTGVPSVVLNEDDVDVVPLFVNVAYPAATTVLAPGSCRVGRWAEKTIAYRGYHETAYLRPERFPGDGGKVRRAVAGEERLFLLRFAALTAHHDRGAVGIDSALAKRLIEAISPHGHIAISSERPLPPELERYRARIDPSQLHDLLASADLYIGDSQTMAAEAAVLGVPSIRYNGFVGRIGYLRELEEVYGLTIGIDARHPGKLLQIAQTLARDGDLKQQWAERRRKLLDDTVDLTSLLVWLIQTYPESLTMAAQDAAVRDRFRLCAAFR